MKVKLITALIALLILGATLRYTQNMQPRPIQTSSDAQQESNENLASFPDIAFPTADGKTYNVRTMGEKIILVHFWAAWCAVCYTEFPDLLKYVAHSNGKVALLSVSLDDDYKESRKALDKIAAKNHLDIQAPHLYYAWDKDKILSLKIFNTVKVPETIIVNDKRQMADKIIGVGPWDEASTPQ